MQRLAALVPRPRLHLICFHGVLAPNAKLRAAIVPQAVRPTSEPAHEHAHGQAATMSWARQLKRVFDIDVEHCVCGGELKIIAAIEDPVVIVRMLTHLGLPVRAAVHAHSLIQRHNNGCAPEPTGLLGPRSRDGVKTRLVNADSGRCRA